jgi:aldehyde:ferredoxin oxidoreductase
MQIWRVNVQNQSLSRETVPPTWEVMGGRGLLARILLEEVPPTCDPLGPNNKLIFSPGLLTGHMLSCCDRLSVGAKSPLTGGTKESNSGGSTAMALSLLGIKTLILEGQPNQKGLSILYLHPGGVRFDPADDFSGLGVYAAAQKLLERYGDKVSISVIGPGGELELRTAGILNLDKDRIPSRINGRGGLGAVMGSKKIKAIVFDVAGCGKQPIAHPQAFQEAQKIYTQSLLNHPQSTAYREYGTAGTVRLANAFRGLPTRNFSEGSFESVEAISGENLRDLLLKRAGDARTSHACMAGCTVQCSNVFADENGKQIVSPLEYETIGLMGSNLGISSLDQIAQLNWEVNDLGLDSIDIGAALGVAAEAGLMSFGDGHRALELVGEIRKGTPLGRILGQGAAITGQVLGVKHIPVVKGQAISAYDPRAIKGTGVTYATSPQGADHTAGLTIRAKIDHLDPKIQADVSRSGQINNAGYDTLGACLFASFGFAASPESIRDLLNARYDWHVDTDILQVLGRETIKTEREFNRRAGFTAADDRIPEWMTREPLASTGTVFDVAEADLDGIFDW